jgi:hypothetical protein
MLGSLLSAVTKVATLPLDLTNAVVGKVFEGDMSKETRTSIPLTGDLEQLRDEVCDVMKEIDE